MSHGTLTFQQHDQRNVYSQQNTNLSNGQKFCPCFQHDTVKHCSLVTSSGATDVGSGSSYVHSVRHWCVPGPYYLHEELGRQPTRQEKQEAAGLHLPNQK